MSERGTKSDTNYQPSRINNKPDDAKYKQSKREYSNVFITQDKIDKPNDFKQAGDFYRSLDKKNQENLLKNLLADLKQVTNKDIQK